MALVSEKHNFIFIHIYRTGGNSVRKALGAPAVGYFTDLLGGQEVLGVHVEANDLQQHYKSIGRSTFFNNAYKFTVVRNPFSWLTSVYKYIKYSTGHNFNLTVKDKSYFDFLCWYANYAMAMSRPFGSNKYSTQHDFIYNNNGNIIVDYVGRSENMSGTLAEIAKVTGIKIQEIPKINKTPAGLPGWKSYYKDQRCIKFIQRHFKCDLETFGYSWR